MAGRIEIAAAAAAAATVLMFHKIHEEDISRGNLPPEKGERRANK